MSRYGKLTISETENVLDWFLHHVQPEQRRRLMAELPQHYSKLFPDVDPEIISGMVLQAMKIRKAADDG